MTICVLSPAKTLDMETTRDDLPPASTPRFEKDAETIAAAAANLTVERLMKLMGISRDLATLNAARFRGFADAPGRPALQAFAGDVYDGLDAATLDHDAIAFAQDNVRILSGLYGVLRPMDLMRPYRLEMGTKWAPRRDRMTDWWRDRVAVAVDQDVDASGEDALLNLASEEYFAVLKNRLRPTTRIVDAHFVTGGRFVTFHAKVARGLAARWLIRNRVERVDDMRGFDAGGYAFVAAESDATRFTFRRAD